MLLNDFKQELIELQEWILRYNSSSRGQHKLRTIMREFDRQSIPYCYANNFYSRAKFAEAALPALSAFSASRFKKDWNTQLFLVTLAPAQFAMPLDSAAQFDARRLQAWARHYLHGFDYFGMVEPALYTNWKPAGAQDPLLVAWHSHLLLWTANGRELSQTIARINMKCRSVFPYARAAHVSLPVPPGDLGVVLRYMLKPPFSEYRIFKRKGEWINPNTGEVITDRRLRQHKRRMRPGNAIKMCAVMSEKFLDELSFGGGDGTRVHREIRDAVLAEYNRIRNAYPRRA